MKSKTTVTYNNVVLHNIHTTRWESEPIYDQSGADQLGTRYRLRFEGICHVQFPPTTGFQVEGGGPPFITVTSHPEVSPTDLVQFVRRALEQSRKKLIVSVGDDILLQANAGNETANNTDIDSGPKPQRVEITRFVSGNLYEVAFEIEVSLADCGSGHRPFVLNNRWSIQESMDTDRFVTRTIRGRLRIATSTIPVHAYKGLTIPGLEAGFRRERIDFTVTADGLSADWEVVDRQVAVAVPWPATRFEIFHSESTADGARFFSDCRVVLWGSPAADKRLLIQRGVQILESRINFVQRITTAELLEGFEIIDITSGEESRIEVRGRISGPADTDAVARIRSESIGQPLQLPPLAGREYQANVQEPPPIYGENTLSDEAARSPVVLFLLSCPQQRFCGGNHQIAKGGQPSQPPSGPEAPDESPSMSARTVGATLPQEDPTTYSLAHYEGVYSYARYSSEYITDENVVAMPIADESSPNATRTVNVFQLGQPNGMRRIEIDVERIGLPPQVPAPLKQYVDGDLVGRLKAHRIKPMAPTLTADGRKKIYHIRASYLYILNKPPSVDQRISVGVLPFTAFSTSDNQLPLSEVYSPELGP